MAITINNLQIGFFRIAIILALQILVIKNIQLPWNAEGMASFFLFPAAIIFIPSQISRPLTLFVAFICGLIIDMFYDTPGVAAGAMVIMAYIRPIAFSIIEPQLGVKIGQESSSYQFGFISLLIFASILQLVFCFFYYSFEYFSLYYIVDIMIRTVYSFILSMLLVSVYIVIFRPKL